LNTLSEDSSIFNQLYTIDNNNLITKNVVFSDYNQNSDDFNTFKNIKYAFIPSSISKETEEIAIFTKINQLINANFIVLIN
ncbi:27284_t:CDS:1, partial [Racocetra persica]